MLILPITWIASPRSASEIIQSVFCHGKTESSPVAKPKHHSYKKTADLQRSSWLCDVLQSWDMASISCNPQENWSISYEKPEEDWGPTMFRLRQKWDLSATHKAVSVFVSSSRLNLTMVSAPVSNATTSTRKDDLRLWPCQSRLEATSWPTEETYVRQPVRFLDDGKHETGRRANTHHVPKWMEEADITLYTEQRPAGDLSQVNQSWLQR